MALLAAEVADANPARKPANMARSLSTASEMNQGLLKNSIKMFYVLMGK